MSADYEEQKKDIEVILQKIYNIYHGFKSETLYYKRKGKRNIKKSYEEQSIKRAIEDIISRFTVPDLEYALYINKSHWLNPSKDCIKELLEPKVFDCDFVFQFFPDCSLDCSEFYELDISVVPDPLTQILTYHNINSHKPKHAYICSGVYIIEPYNPDPTSIFPGRRGVVAYCTSFNNFISRIISGDWSRINMKLAEELPNKALNRLDVDVVKLWKKDPVKACDINLIEKYMHNEIEEANKLMEQYDIIRVAFPLD